MHFRNFSIQIGGFWPEKREGNLIRKAITPWTPDPRFSNCIRQPGSIFGESTNGFEIRMDNLPLKRRERAFRSLQNKKPDHQSAAVCLPEESSEIFGRNNVFGKESWRENSFISYVPNSLVSRNCKENWVNWPACARLGDRELEGNGDRRWHDACIDQTW